ncbi:ABC transporter permease subunit [Falsiroseomonas oryzae]|uniref:ABC transporter permease subunit n=1 Tax=Falsiroseomonas oryzae TaxID=2766473 RepID=UPI0022EA81CC|nr:ABC transporter permease subunit [Roseomonas sp. MO-31]
MLLVLLASVWLVGGTQGSIDLDLRLRPPLAAWSHPLGTDHLGRDLLERILAGALPTIEAVLAGAGFAGLAGLSLGLAGVWPGTAGAMARGAAQLLTAVPGLLAALAVAGAAGGGIVPAVAGLALAVPAAGQAALVVAGLAATAGREGHVRAALALGVTLPRALRRHVWPVLRQAWFAWAGTRLPRIALSYAGLAFLGLGADAGRPDWGAMVWEYRTYALAAPWLPVAPVLGLVALVLSLRGLFAGSAPRDYPGG